MIKIHNRRKGRGSSENTSNKLSGSYDDIMLKLEEKFRDCPDIIMRKVNLEGQRSGYFLYTDNLVNSNLIQRDFMAPILNMKYLELQDKKNFENLPVAKLSILTDIDEIVIDTLSTSTVFIGEGLDYAVSCNLTDFERRGIQEPVSEKNVKGPHEGFVEVLDTNMSILRRNIKNTRLKFKEFTLGAATNQTFAIAYIEGIANPSLLEKLCEKINSLNFDGFPAIGYIEQLIQDHPNSPFPQYQSTERPDKAVGALLEGKFVLMLDGTPVVSIVPVGLYGFFQSLDDYSASWIFGTFLGTLRIFGAFTAMFLPGVYIAILSFHYYAVPLTLLIPLAESRAKVPFPPIVEALFMELTLELLREASIRLPTYISSAVGIVGGIVIGQAAVQAGIVSNLMVIIVAVTATASFTVPNYDMGLAIRIIRFVVMILASIFGIMGIVVSGVTILAHLVTMESLGQPYYQPIVPFKFKDLKDTMIRLPIQFLRRRPDIAKPIDKERGYDNGRKKK